MQYLYFSSFFGVWMMNGKMIVAIIMMTGCDNDAGNCDSDGFWGADYESNEDGGGGDSRDCWLW